MKTIRSLGIATILLLGAQSVGAEEISLPTKSVLNQNSVSYVPTKMVTNQLKARVGWNNQDKRLTISKDNTTILLKMGESKANVDGKVVSTTPIVVKEGVSYLPLRFVAETLHMKVQWSPEAITLTTYDQYIVQKGDYLQKISRKFGLSVEEIQKINNLKDDKLQIGQVLYLKSVPSTSKETNLKEDSNVIYDDMLDTAPASANPSPSQEKTNNETNLADKTNAGNKETPDKETQNKAPQNNGTANFEYTSYVVKKGDNLSKISSENKISLKDLLAANNLTEASIIQIGEQLLLPKRVIPVTSRVSDQYGEYLDWWTEAQYVFPIGEIATVTDFETGVSFQVRRSYGANHADCEPVTAEDTAKAKDVWGGFSWNTRAVLVQVGDRTIAASMSFMPHDIESILDNDFVGHFDIHFKNSTRHKDGKIDNYHQEKIKVAAGLQ